MPQRIEQRRVRAAPPMSDATMRVLVSAAALIMFAALAYARALQVPFLGDDYVFLGKTRYASFAEVWSLDNTNFGWYRPWSRELHFWILQHLFGPHELPFRCANIALWFAALGLQARIAWRLAGLRASAIAFFGTASLSMWGAPLNWISGSQDLWMLVFATLTVGLVIEKRTQWAWCTYVAALLSKETAATLPLILLAHDHFIGGFRAREIARRLAPYAVITLAWLVLHPTLLHRLGHPHEPAYMAESPVPAPIVAAKSALALVNADRALMARDPEAERWPATVGSALALAFGVWLWCRRTPAGAGHAPPHERGAVVRFGCAWCAAGTLPLLMPSVGWHAYYGSLGAVGAWLAIAAALDTRPRIVPMFLLTLGVLRGSAAATRSWDWGSEWYQARAGNMLRVVREQLLTLHPSLPPHSRLYFGNIPNNIGLIAGDSPAVRVWYDDTTMRAGFYSYYRPRGPSEALGSDYFFHFDSIAGLREVFAEGKPLPTGGLTDWIADHESLAMMFVTSRDYPRAARLFAALSAASNRPEYHMYAGVCWRASGDERAAAAEFDTARTLSGGTEAQVMEWAGRLTAAMPTR